MTRDEKIIRNRNQTGASPRVSHFKLGDISELMISACCLPCHAYSLMLMGSAARAFHH